MSIILKVEKIEDSTMPLDGYPIIVTSYGDSLKFRFLFLTESRCMVFISTTVNGTPKELFDLAASRIYDSMKEKKIDCIVAYSSGGWTVDNILKPKDESAMTDLLDSIMALVNKDSDNGQAPSGR